MPKKKVAKVKRAKPGKGKKDGKQESKADKESDVEKARAAAVLWELRLKVTDQSLAEYREASHKLARANEELTNQLYRAEKESIDMTVLMRRQDQAKEDKINVLQKQLKSQDAQAREEQNQLIRDYTAQINDMKELFRKKSSDFNMIQDGMKEMKEFQERKSQMEQELSDIRENMAIADKQHRENLNKMEYKFSKEKNRLEKEAERTIALVLEKAHNDAIVQLDDTLRSVFKENVRLNEALKHHMKEAEDLQLLANALAGEKASLEVDKNTLELMVKKHAGQMEAKKKEASNLRDKVAYLERALALKAGETQRDRKESELVGIQTSQVELEKMRKVLTARERELGQVKRLAGTVVKQRAELERFFHEALAQVKQEVTASRLQYKKEALQAYRRRLKDATAGKVKFPPIRTFHKGLHSTNCVYSDMEAAARWDHPPDGKVEVSDLTWEQKEQVLRLLFAKMNGRQERKASQPLALSAPSEKKSLADSDAAGFGEQLSRATFITQAPESALPSNPSSLPDIQTT